MTNIPTRHFTYPQMKAAMSQFRARKLRSVVHSSIVKKG